MEINRNNYEAYFIDYLEGTLDEQLVDSFIEFIKLNPDLKKELDLFESVSAVPEKISFAKKDTLYKEKFDSEKEFDTAAIALLEGDISDDEKFEFEMYLAEHPEKKNEAALFGQTKLQPEKTIVFANKNKLYRKSSGRVLVMWVSRMAAVFVLGLTLFTLLNKTPKHTSSENKVAEAIQHTTTTKTTSATKNAPVKEEKTTDDKEKILNTADISEKLIHKKKASQTIPKNSNPKIEKEYIALARTPVDVPTELNSITASITTAQPHAKLQTMYLYYPAYEDDYSERFLVDVVKEKTGLSLNKIGKAGLK